MTDERERERLPYQRIGLCVPLTCKLGANDFLFTGHFNFYADGRLGELFAQPFKTGADLESFLNKFCMSVSRMLQHGDRIESYWRCIDDGTPVDRLDIFSALIRGGVETEKELLAEMARSARGEGI